MGGLAARWLGMRMSGKGDMGRQFSDWSLPEALTEEQVEYAAKDALISLLIHNNILDRVLASDQPRRPAVSRGNMSSSSPALISPTPISAGLRSQKAKIARERKHRANFGSLDSSSRILYGNLRALRDDLM